VGIAAHQAGFTQLIWRAFQVIMLICVALVIFYQRPEQRRFV
jgi:hypothetical protein